MIQFQVGDQVRVAGLPTSEWRDAVGVVVETVEGQTGDREAIQECAVQFATGRRWFLAKHLVKTVTGNSSAAFHQ